MANKIPNRRIVEKPDDIFESYSGVNMYAASNYRDNYISIEPNKSVRPSFDRRDYGAFRSGEDVPSKQKNIIRMCMDAYDNVGLIRNVIDLMADFASQGITIVHPNKTTQKFYRNWFGKIKGQQVTERFINYLYRTSNVIVRRTNAKISPKNAKEMKSASATEELIKLAKREIPWSYEFLNPLVVDYKEVDGQVKLVMNLTNSTYNKLISGALNDNIFKTSQTNKYIPLDMKATRVFYYKKDDWLPWANPMVRPILDDISRLEKMKLADLAALDGAISNIRLWNIGSLEHKIMPKKAAVDKLRDILASNVGGGTLDLIWGPDLTFEETNSQVYKFLGVEKYVPVLSDIYSGLGIPLSLTGAGGSSGTTNNFVSLKALIERLEYGRQVVLDFWNYEFKLVQESMGFSSPAKIHFDSVVLSDEAGIKAILIDLWDRNILSTETLQERFKEFPEIENSRNNKEFKDSMDPNVPKKAGPFHNPQHREDMAKMALTGQVLNVEEYFKELGVPSQKPPVIPGPTGKGLAPAKKPKKVSSPTGGRPQNSKDTVTRTQKRVLPRAKALDTGLYLWATHAQEKISDIIIPFILEKFNKKNIRSFTKAEMDSFENMKLSILLSMEEYSEVNSLSVKNAIQLGLKPSSTFNESVDEHVKSFMSKCHKKPAVEDLRTIYAITFAELK